MGLPAAPKNRPLGLKCPECGGERLFRDGLRRLAGGSATQRWLCRECGYRFSEKRMEKPVGKGLKSGSALNFNRRVCAPEGGVENSAGRLATLAGEEKADAEGRAAGATEKHKVSELLFNFAWWLKKGGYAESTIETRVKLLKILAKRGANLLDKESVKGAIAKQNWCNKRKVNAADAYTIFLRIRGERWEPPRYRVPQRLPFIPTEAEIDALIAGCGPKTAVFLQLLKETGMRAGEAQRLRWVDIDLEAGAVRVTLEKGSKPRILKLSSRLLSMLNALKSNGRSERVFGRNLRTIRRLFQRQRATLARKLQDPRLLQIHFHTFRH